MFTKGFCWPALCVPPRVSGGLLEGIVIHLATGFFCSVGYVGGAISSMMSRALVRVLKNFGSGSGGISTTCLSHPA